MPASSPLLYPLASQPAPPSSLGRIGSDLQMWSYVSATLIASALYIGATDAAAAPSPLSALIAISGHWCGQLLLLNLAACFCVCAVRLLQWVVFGRLRMVELTVISHLLASSLCTQSYPLAYAQLRAF